MAAITRLVTVCSAFSDGNPVAARRRVAWSGVREGMTARLYTPRPMSRHGVEHRQDGGSARPDRARLRPRERRGQDVSGLRSFHQPGAAEERVLAPPMPAQL